MPMGFYTEHGGQGTQNLETIFQVNTLSPAGGTTGFYDGVYWGADLAQIFAPLSSGSRLPYNTGFIARDGRDLADWFAASGTVIVNYNAIFTIGVAYLGQELTYNKYGWQNGVGGSIAFIGGNNDPGVEFIYEAVDINNPDPLSFVRFVGGGRPWNIPDNGRLYFRSTRNNTGQVWTGWYGYSSGSGNWQTIDNSGFSQGVGENFTFELRSYPF